MAHVKSSLHYPGGKSKALDKIMPYIPLSICEYREPFVGEGSVFLAVKQLFGSRIKPEVLKDSST